MKRNKRHKYEALSYTWGSPEQTVEIHCGPNQVHVAQNCYDALVHLRDPEILRKLWIYAICIDQNSLDERNHQVKLMDQVYSNAKRVLVWLDNGSCETDASIEYIKRFTANQCMNTYIHVLWSLLAREVRQLSGGYSRSR